MPFKLVIFDWDGTIMDSIDKIVNSLQLAAISCGVDVPGAEASKRIIGLSLEKAVAELFPKETTKWASLVEAYKYQYKYIDMTPTPIFDGVESLLLKLRQSNVKVAVATGKSRAGLNRMLEESGLGQYFDMTKTADEAESKPHPQMILDLLAALNIDAADAVMIGDTVIDMQLAINANVTAIGVTLGVDTKSRLMSQGASVVVDNYDQLARVLSAEHIKPKVI
jgi:phosphoglycolate phosphatase